MTCGGYGGSRFASGRVRPGSAVLVIRPGCLWPRLGVSAPNVGGCRTGESDWVVRVTATVREACPLLAAGGGPLVLRGGESRGGPHARVSARGPDPGAHCAGGVKSLPENTFGWLPGGGVLPPPGGQAASSSGIPKRAMRVNGSAGAWPVLFRRPGFHLRSKWPGRVVDALPQSRPRLFFARRVETTNPPA